MKSKARGLDRQSAQAVQAIVFGFLLALAGAASAQPFPSKPLRFIVASAAGTSPDISARQIGAEMTKKLGQPIVVEIRAGANGTIGAKAVASAEPDGYTSYFGGHLSQHPIFNKNNAVDFGKELTAVSNLQSGPYFLYVRSTLPVSSLQDLVSYSKANPGKLNFAYPTPNTQLLMQMLKAKTGLSYADIPYTGGPQTITALLSSQADVTMNTLPPFPPQLQAGAIKAVFTTWPTRSTLLPNVPTAAEVGVPDYVVGFSLGLWGVPGTPRDRIQKLSEIAAGAVHAPEIVAQFRGLGAEAVGSTPEEQLRNFESQIKFWAEAARIANYRPE